jgi:hypothetical protein
VPETTADRPPVAEAAATVSAPALAAHIDCSRAYIDKLEADGVIRRQGDGFPLDQQGQRADRRDRRCHTNRIVEPACAMRAAWRSRD